MVGTPPLPPPHPTPPTPPPQRHQSPPHPPHPTHTPLHSPTTETRHTFEVVRKETTFAELKAKVAAKLGLTPSAFKLGYPEPWCYEPSPKHKLTHHDARVYIGDMLEVQVYE